MNPIVGALPANAARIAAMARQAQAAGAELAIFPELTICGYPPRDLAEKPDFVAHGQDWLRWASAEVPGITLICGCLTPADSRTGKSVHNSAQVLADGEVLFTQKKMLLPTYDVFDDSRNFAPAESQQTWNWRGHRLAITICEDAWNDKKFWPRRHARLLYNRDPVAEQMDEGAALLINLSASPYTTGKMQVRREMLAALAAEYRVPVLFVNQVGGNDELVFDGSSQALAPDGEVIARAASFREDLLLVDLPGGGRREPEPAEEERALLEALVLGTRDYVAKCGFRRVVIGLSGGVDSALTAVIAARALGPEQVLGLALPTRFTSQASLRDAAQLAANLGIELRTVPIEPMFAAALASLPPHWAGLPECDPGAITEQNLQSRLRGLTLMAFANRTGALVLSTGNKSELATGYCTLYGDMAGGLAVISDLLKTQVYRLCHYLNREQEVIPRTILEKAPSAELRFDQTDQDDLPPYEAVDAVIRGYVENYKTGEQIAAETGLDATLVRGLIRRIDRSEYKRQQAAPGLKVSGKAFGMGRRFPIAQQYEDVPASSAASTAAEAISTENRVR